MHHSVEQWTLNKLNVETLCCPLKAQSKHPTETSSVSFQRLNMLTNLGPTFLDTPKQYYFISAFTALCFSVYNGRRQAMRRMRCSYIISELHHPST